MGSVSNRLCDLRKADSNLWIDVTKNDSSLRFCHLISAMQNCNPVSLAFTVVIYENFTWQLYVGSHLVDISCLSSFPNVIDGADYINAILTTLQAHKVCPGNPDEKFVSMVESSVNTGVIMSRKSSGVSGSIDNTAVVFDYSKTVRSAGCETIIPCHKMFCLH